MKEGGLLLGEKVMKKFYTIFGMLFLVSSGAFGAADEGINLRNYKDFEGRSAYAILGVRLKNAGDLMQKYQNLEPVLNPKRYIGTEDEQVAREAYDLMRQAYFKILYPGPSRDYQIKLADMEGYAWDERRHHAPYVTQPYHLYTPHFDEGDWVKVKEMSIAEDSQVAQGCGNCAHNIQLLARAVINIHDTLLKLQQQFEAPEGLSGGTHQSPELETAY